MRHRGSNLRCATRHLQRSRRSGRGRVAAPEREGSKEDGTSNNRPEPMIYDEEKVEYSNGAVVKVSFCARSKEGESLVNFLHIHFGP